MDAGGKEELAIRGGFHTMTCCRKLQILYQLNLSPAGIIVAGIIVAGTAGTVIVIFIPVTIGVDACLLRKSPSQVFISLACLLQAL